eukprot:jgi/Mesvir1/26305/Mv18805-RA.1
MASNPHSPGHPVNSRRGASPNIPDEVSRVPLHLAIMLGHEKIVEMLIAAGADLNVEDHEGMTPMKIALVKKHATFIQMLMKGGAKLTSLSRTKSDVIEGPVKSSPRASGVNGSGGT